MIFSKAAERKTVKTRSKPSEYEAMLRNGFIMPKLNSTIVNKIYMYRVKSMMEYCPLTSEIKVYKICINPPSKDYLLGQIQEELVKRSDERDLTYDAGHLPDVEWCVKALLALNPDHHIFDKDYVPSSNERGRKGNKFEQSFQDEEIKRFDEFDKGLPPYLHQPYMKPNPQYSGRPYHSKKNSMKIDDDTLTDKDIQDENEDINIQSENKMEILEPRNPFLKASRKNLFSQNANSLQFSQNGFFEIPGHSQSQAQVQYLHSQKNLDLQSTLKQLNGQLFSSNISKNKSKKKLNPQEEEMIVRMFEKLVVNCKGRPVDFVKSYLDQYHSEKNPPIPSSTFGSKHLQLGTFNNFSNSTHSTSKTQQVQASPNKSKGFNFIPFQQQASHQFNSNENHVQASQFQCDSLPEEKTQIGDIRMTAQNGITNGNDDDDQNFKDVIQSEYEASSNFTSAINGNTGTQSVSSFSHSQSPNQQLFNI